MDDEEPVSELYPEQLVAENIAEAVWLRLRRLTSSTLCQRVIEARNPSLPVLVLEKKGQEVASSVRSALGYWQSQAASLNAKVLARYYALLQMSIAEQLASPDSTADLKEIQSHTESGHGLCAITAHGKDFPASYMVACRNRGHFYEYCRFRGIDLTPYVSKVRPNSWDDLSTVERDRLISLADLLRRIPELQLLIEETGNYPFDIGNTMCCTVAASADSTVEAGAPEVEITPAMTRAGAELIWSYFYDAMVYEDPSGQELAEAVFLAMTRQSFSNEAKSEQKSS